MHARASSHRWAARAATHLISFLEQRGIFRRAFPPPVRRRRLEPAIERRDARRPGARGITIMLAAMARSRAKCVFTVPGAPHFHAHASKRRPSIFVTKVTIFRMQKINDYATRARFSSTPRGAAAFSPTVTRYVISSAADAGYHRARHHAMALRKFVY